MRHRASLVKNGVGWNAENCTSVRRVLTVSASPSAFAQHNSKQVVFSGTGSGAFNNTTSPFGFWIWCEGSSSNSYVGACSGAMYVDALGITRPVSGTVTEANSLFTMDVNSRVISHGNTPVVSCTLSNVAAPTSGPTNTVDVSCTAPSGSGSSTNAVVIVSGP
jgi:hypothetical protein